MMRRYEPLNFQFDTLLDLQPESHVFKHIFDNGTKNVFELGASSKAMTTVQSLKEGLLSEMTYCKISFSRTTYQRMVTSRRATTSDKISLIGGTLGLFTGISFVSIVEIVFWIGKALSQKITCSGSTVDSMKTAR